MIQMFVGKSRDKEDIWFMAAFIESVFTIFIRRFNLRYYLNMRFEIYIALIIYAHDLIGFQ